jgi:hypothetical protein
MRRLQSTLAAALVALAAGSAQALTVPFTEDFTSTSAGWVNNGFAPLTFQASGGPDGGSHASTPFSYFGFVPPMPGQGPVIFRGHEAFDASGDAFVGDWLAGGVTQASAWVFQDTGVSLNYFLRIASPFNNNGAVFINTTPVQSGVWTQLTWTIDPNSMLCIGEQTTCAVSLANVGNLQIGTSAPSSLTSLNQSFTLAIDKVSIVPEPGTLLLAASGLVGLGVFRRRAA